MDSDGVQVNICSVGLQHQKLGAETQHARLDWKVMLAVRHTGLGGLFPAPINPSVVISVTQFTLAAFCSVAVK
jgi:hypothetical protein